MARTVDTSSTLENFRQEHNNLANDIGAIGNLTTGDTSSIVNAINYIMDQYFFFQDFDFDGSDGATSNTVFSGADNSSNTLQYAAGKVLVYKNGLLLRNGTDYTASNGTSVTLASSANNGDVIRVTSYTGSYQNVNSDASTAFDQWQQAGSTIYNKNTGGIVINADSSITTSLSTADTIQLQGLTHSFGDIYIDSVSGTRKEVRFQDSDNSHSVGLRAPATIGSNFSLVLPTADGSDGQYLKTDGSGNLSFGTVSATAPDVTVTANNSTDETVYPVFVDGATGSQGVESDSGLTYNPSTGRITSTEYYGNIILATQNSITTMTALNAVGTIGSGTWQGTAIARAYIANDAIDATKIDDNAVGAAALNISGNGSSGQALLSDGDGSFSYGAGGKTTEEIQDIAGAMFTSNTETGITATYEDGDGTIDLVIGSGAITNGMLATDSVTASKIGANEVNASELNVSGNGSTSQFLRSDGDGTFTWATPTDTDTNTTYSAGTGMSLSGTTFACTVTDTNTTYTAGSNMSLSGTEFSATNTTYSAGSNMSLSGTTFSATNTTYSAGSNMSLSGTTFSATNTTYSAGVGLSLSGTQFSIPTGSGLQVASFGVGTGASGTTGQIRATNDITAYYSSDIALKENINPISNALDKISKIGGYTFDWTDKFIKENGGEDDYFMRKKDTGIIAQEIEEILPEVVATRPNGTKAVKYDKLTPLLIQAIKELKTELDDLKSSNS